MSMALTRRARTAGRSLYLAATELLIVDDLDGSLTVRKSQEDGMNGFRKNIANTWSKWVADAERNSTDRNEPNGSERKKPGSGRSSFY
jgi:hypothetical protein